MVLLNDLDGVYVVDMTAARASDLIGRRIKDVRTARGWTAADLARRCADIGTPTITASVIANIETGRRDKDGRRRREVTVDEVLTLSYALAVPPVFLFLPIEDGERLQVSPDVEMDAVRAAPWVTGDDTVSPYEIFIEIDSPPSPSDEEFKRWAHWRRHAMPVRHMRDIWLLSSKLVDLEKKSGDDAADSMRANVINELATLIEWFGNVGLTPPALPRSVVDALRNGADLDRPLEYPGELLISIEDV